MGEARGALYSKRLLQTHGHGTYGTDTGTRTEAVAS